MFRFLTEHMIDVYVGAEQKKFHLHRDLLCDRSEYFKACFDGNFKEAQQKELYLPEDDIESFDLFVRWLYGAPLKKISSDDDLLVYLALIVLANKLCLEYLQNEAMDHILRFHRKIPGSVRYDCLHYIYQNTSSHDHIRSYSVSLAAWTTVSKQPPLLTADCIRLIREGGDLAVDFTFRLSLFYAKSKGDHEAIAWMDPRKASNCCYHKHNSTPVCSKSST